MVGDPKTCKIEEFITGTKYPARKSTNQLVVCESFCEKNSYLGILDGHLNTCWLSRVSRLIRGPQPFGDIQRENGTGGWSLVTFGSLSKQSISESSTLHLGLVLTHVKVSTVLIVCFTRYTVHGTTNVRWITSSIGKNSCDIIQILIAMLY